MTRELVRQTRRDLASWQRAALGLLALSVGVNTALCAAITRQERQIEDLETRYHAVRAIEADAVAAYGELAARVDADREARQAQAEAYEAIGAYEYIGECTVTYYCCEPYAHVCGDGDGLTATGIPVTPGVVAVDPEVIPLGSTVIIDGQAYLAADTGGTVRGNHVDIAVATHQEAEALGTTTTKVWIIEEEDHGN